MSLQNILQTGLNRLRSTPKKYLIAGLILLVAISYGVIFRERTLAYAYAGETCDRQAVLLPKLFKQSGSDEYDIYTKDSWKIGDYPLVSTSVCAQPTEAPATGSSEVVRFSPFGGLFARLSYKVEVPSAPQLQLKVLERPIAASRALVIPLSIPDDTFEYRVKSDTQQATCDSKDKELRCDIPALAMKQGQTYKVAVERYFDKQLTDTVATKEVATLSPVTITASSIGAGSTVYDKPTTVTIDTDKPIQKAQFSLKTLGDGEAEPRTLTSAIKGNSVVVDFGGELPRTTDFELIADEFEAKDGSTPLDAYVLPFKTSGGPKVTGINVGTSGIGQSATIVVTFDQELSERQDMNSVVSVVGVPATVVKQPNSIIIQLNGAPKCQDFTISIKKEIQSKYDIAADDAWSRAQRITCYSVSVAGYSRQGRAITAYEFGNGSRTILFVAAIHGNEYSTYSLMQRWIAELEANGKNIPADKRIVIVPQINPDGVARGDRENANNVDLNRNFATGDWSKDITTVANQPFPGGGGESAMSEPETQAMASLASRLQPELTLSYHSIGGLLAANQAGQSNSLASTYSRLSGYRNTTGQASSTFEYAISGTWDDWLAEKLGCASILIELGSHSYHQFERNQDAMWAMVKS